MKLSRVILPVLSTTVRLINAQDLPPVVDCGSVSQANDIALRYPMNATGILNGTLAMLPMSMDMARSMIPSQYKILTNAIQDVLPGLPTDTYPALLQLMHDHDVRYGTIKMNDFQRASIEFPFLDLLGDGSTSFRWSGTMFLTGTNLIGIGGIAAYGSVALPSVFSPSCNALDEVAPGKWTFRASATNTTADCADGKPCLTSSFTIDPAPDMRILEYFVNATNQPSFGDGSTCDNQIRLFEDTNAGAAWKPVPVTGQVSANGVIPTPAGEKDSNGVWESVKGFHAPSRFIENNYISCEQLRGYGADTVQQLLDWTPPAPPATATMQVRSESLISLENSIVANSTMPEYSPAPPSLSMMMKRFMMTPASLMRG